MTDEELISAIRARGWGFSDIGTCFKESDLAVVAITPRGNVAFGDFLLLQMQGDVLEAMAFMEREIVAHDEGMENGRPSNVAA